MSKGLSFRVLVCSQAGSCNTGSFSCSTYLHWQHRSFPSTWLLSCICVVVAAPRGQKFPQSSASGSFVTVDIMVSTFPSTLRGRLLTSSKGQLSSKFYQSNNTMIYLPSSKLHLCHLFQVLHLRLGEEILPWVLYLIPRDRGCSLYQLILHSSEFAIISQLLVTIIPFIANNS